MRPGFEGPEARCAEKGAGKEGAAALMSSSSSSASEERENVGTASAGWDGVAFGVVCASSSVSTEMTGVPFGRRIIGGGGIATRSRSALVGARPPFGLASWTSSRDLSLAVFFSCAAGMPGGSIRGVGCSQKDWRYRANG